MLRSYPAVMLFEQRAELTSGETVRLANGEERARVAGIEPLVAKLSLAQVPRSLAAHDTRGNRRVRETSAMFKVIVDRKADRIVGAHLLGPQAEEVINLFALSIRSRVPATDLKHMVYAYPTGSSDVPYTIP